MDGDGFHPPRFKDDRRVRPLAWESVLHRRRVYFGAELSEVKKRENLLQDNLGHDGKRESCGPSSPSDRKVSPLTEVAGVTLTISLTS